MGTTAYATMSLAEFVLVCLFNFVPRTFTLTWAPSQVKGPGNEVVVCLLFAASFVVNVKIMLTTYGKHPKLPKKKYAEEIAEY